MSYNLVVKEEAVADIQEAYDFYDDVQADLGFRFLQELEQHLEEIKQHPLHFSFLLDQDLYRSYSLKHFPFSIIFEVTVNEVIVFAVHDHRKHPVKTSKRFKNS